LLIAADLEQVIPVAVAGEALPGDRDGVIARENLFVKVRVGRTELVAIIAVNRQADGRWYYNTVVVSDPQKKGDPGAYASPRSGVAAVPLGETLLTGVDSFVRRPFDRVNPDTVSKVVDANGEPLVVYHGTDGDFTVFDPDEARQNADIPGFYFAKSRAEAEEYGGKVLPAFLNIRNPRENPPPVRMGGRAARQRLENGGFDGVIRYEDTPQDAALVEFIALHPEQIKSATGNSGAFDPTNPDIRFSRRATDVSPLGFYSELARKIEAGPGKADAANWKAFIKSQKGIKPDEIEWTGINEFLDIQPGKITKEAVREYLAASGVKVEETVLGSPRRGYYSSDPRWGMEARFEYFEEAVSAAMEAFDLSRNEAESFAAETDETVRRGRLPDETKFEQYKVPGGENYREVLLTLPASRDAERLRELQLATVSGRATLEQRMERAAFEDRGVRDTAFRSLHWYQPNVLAHVRFDERTDADGKRVLFINEIQSDWAQKGRKEGFKPPTKTYSVTDIDGILQGQFPNAQEAAEYASRFRGGHVTEYIDSKGVPRAPFVEKTEAWVALLLKRMIRYAAENGFDRVAIVTGEQAADMFDLSKRVGRIVWSEDIGRLSAYDLDRKSIVVDETGVTREKLPDFVGKEVAERLAGAAPNNIGVRQLDGDDLKVGGEGMKKFYPRSDLGPIGTNKDGKPVYPIVQVVANDVLKKLGGVNRPDFSRHTRAG